MGQLAHWNNVKMHSQARFVCKLYLGWPLALTRLSIGSISTFVKPTPIKHKSQYSVNEVITYPENKMLLVFARIQSFRIIELCEYDLILLPERTEIG